MGKEIKYSDGSWGRTDDDGNIYRDGSYDGRIDDDGNLYDRHGYYSGRVDSSGTIRDKHGSYSGSVDSDGTVRDKDGNITAETRESSSGCFLTTACVDFMGLPDDCVQLELLRKYRDTYLIGRENGKNDIQEYYRTAPGIIDKISLFDHAKQKEIYGYIYGVVEECVTCINNDDNEKAYHLYKDMVSHLSNVIK